MPHDSHSAPLFASQPHAGWNSCDSWRVLHTAWCQGLPFLQTWRAWLSDPLRPRLLHYVALVPDKPDVWDGRLPGSAPGDEDRLQELRRQCGDLGPGQHRLCFEGGRVLLTLCQGPALVMLRQQQFDADAVVLDASPQGAECWDAWTLKTLARLCRRGTRVELVRAAPRVLLDLRQCGFEMQAPDGDPAGVHHGVFNPRWELKTTREPWRSLRCAPDTCVVVGAGLTGASVAASLARRGWRVQVLDQAATPATGASGLPVGLAVPHTSVDDCVLSRLTRAGVRLSLQQAQWLLKAGVDWSPSGVHEHLFDDTASQPLAPRWHPGAGWVKPSALVHAWLQQGGIRFQGNASVHGLRRCEAGWTLLDSTGHAITMAARVVLANANGALPVLRQLQAKQVGSVLSLEQLPTVYGVRGLVSWAQHPRVETRPFPPGPVNGSGSLISRVPFGDVHHWYVGASYQPPGKPEWPDDKNHGANVLRLEKLQPALFDALTPELEAGRLQAWKGVRCVTADRLPLVGSVLPGDPSLWLCAGMGSRGLALAHLCAELLAAQWAGEPLPLEASLAHALYARRHRTAGKGMDNPA